MSELLPMASGLLLGALLGWLRPALRLPIGAPLAVVLGVCATVASGEFRTSWDYLFVDIPLVTACAALAMLATRHVRVTRAR